MPWNLFDVFVNVLVFSFKSKIFIARLSVERVELSIPTIFVVWDCWHFRRRGPGNHLRWHAAPLSGAQRPRGGCRAFAFKRGCGGRHEQRWRGASKREAGRESRLQLDWKCLHFQQMFGKVVSFHCNMPICVENAWSDLQMEHKSPDGPLSRMLQSLRLPGGTGRRSCIQPGHLYNKYII